MIPSISYDQHEILRWINKLHLNGEWIECDPCYGNGSFYKPKDIPTPKYIFDINPERAPEADCRNLPLDGGCVKSLIFDPPFLQTTGKGSIIKDRFGSYSSMEELWRMYLNAIGEFARVLSMKGTLIVKMQNAVMSGRQWWSVDTICDIAKIRGFEKKDEFILLAKHRMGQHNLKKQRHARKYHSFFLVFVK